ncbi:aldo/keto reductase [Rhizobium sp. NLR17b]|nr:aldo/keto reductase [Rhizobium sp. NLR17b]
MLGNVFSEIDENVAHDTLLAAARAGNSPIDTSPFYGAGLSELRVGRILRALTRDSLVISTKVGRVAEALRGAAIPSQEEVRNQFAKGLPHRLRFDYSFDGTMRSVEQSLLRLGTDYLDILLIHDVDVWTHGDDGFERRFSEAMNGSYRALERLRSEGVVKAIGVGINEAEICVRFAHAGDFDVMLLAGRYSLLEQPAALDFLPLALEKRIGVLLGGVFNSGILATGPIAGARYNYRPAPPSVLKKVTEMQAICEAHGVNLFEAALQFPLAHPAVSSLVLGAVSPQEVARNIEAVRVEIPRALWEDLKAAHLLERSAPTPA